MTRRYAIVSWLRRLALVVIVLAAATVAIAYWLGTADDPMPAATTTDFSDPLLIQRGAYLALAGNCVTCHTARGGPAYAGGRATETPFGVLYGPNITPDADTGIGRWSADDFWRALHNGKSRDGTLLYPSFPYPDYTRVTRADADALYAYLRSLPAVARATPPNTLRFPYNQQIALAFWRALYFRPGIYQEQSDEDAAWNRGAYLVNGLTHCAACHTPRNALGATRRDAPLTGGRIPQIAWYAPPLTGDHPLGLGQWSEEQLSALMKTGISERGTASGPMAEVVFQSLQHLSDEDIQAMSGYLKTLPASRGAKTRRPVAPGPAVMTRGAGIYESQCADCHGAGGEGRHPAYPRLSGNLSVIAPDTGNAIRAVLNGGFAPGTGGNPRPYGMPPFRQTLNDGDVAAVVSYIRHSWGNEAAPVGPAEVRRYRSMSLN